MPGCLKEQRRLSGSLSSASRRWGKGQMVLMTCSWLRDSRSACYQVKRLLAICFPNCALPPTRSPLPCLPSPNLPTSATLPLSSDFLMAAPARFLAVQDFFGGEAGVEGADVSSSEGTNAGGGEGPVSLDEQEIWREMKRVLQLQEQHGLMDDATSEEGSSFYGEASSEDEEGVWSCCDSSSRRPSPQRTLLPSCASGVECIAQSMQHVS